jgi:hypothetical protein
MAQRTAKLARIRDEIAEVCAITTVVIACDKREAFAHGSESDEAIHLRSGDAEQWIASWSLSSGAHSRDPLARNDRSGAQKYRGSSSLPRLRGERGTS